MKSKLLSLFFLMGACAFSQNPIPNPGFENWNAGSPTGWSANNLPGIVTPILQSNSSNSGSSAARLEVVNAFSTALPPVLFLTAPASVSQDYQNVSFYYKGNLLSGDELSSIVTLENSGNPIGTGIAALSNINANVYTQTVMTIMYTNTGATDLNITFLISNPSSTASTVGSYAIIDDIAVAASVGLNESTEKTALSLGQIQPNPLNGLGLIPFSLSTTSEVSIELYSIDGKKVMDVLYTELNAGNYKAELNASQLSTGVYLCKMHAENKLLCTKLIVN